MCVRFVHGRRIVHAAGAGEQYLSKISTSGSHNKTHTHPQKERIYNNWRVLDLPLSEYKIGIRHVTHPSRTVKRHSIFSLFNMLSMFTLSKTLSSKAVFNKRSKTRLLSFTQSKSFHCVVSTWRMAVANNDICLLLKPSPTFRQMILIMILFIHFSQPIGDCLPHVTKTLHNFLTQLSSQCHRSSNCMLTVQKWQLSLNDYPASK